MNSTHQLLTEAYRAFNAREIDAVLALMQPDVDWPNGMEGGREIGREAVRSYWTRQWATINPHVDPVRIEEDHSGRFIVEVHQVVRELDGKLIVDQTVHHVYTLRDGLIARMEIREEA
jgi:ketosteroid isomerase-like protein